MKGGIDRLDGWKGENSTGRMALRIVARGRTPQECRSAMIYQEHETGVRLVSIEPVRRGAPPGQRGGEKTSAGGARLKASSRSTPVRGSEMSRTDTHDGSEESEDELTTCRVCGADIVDGEQVRINETTATRGPSIDVGRGVECESGHTYVV